MPPDDAALRAARAWAAPGWDALRRCPASGPTFAARDAASGERVALKLAPASPSDALADALTRLRMRREAWAWAAAHPHQPARPRVCLRLGRAGLVLPWVDGEPLASLSPGTGPEAWARVCALARQLHALHQLGVVHRDLHPDNACAPPALPHRARLIDLGAAYVPGLAPDDAARWQGHPDFSAPEHRAHPPAPAGPATDRFAFGRLAQAHLAPHLPHAPAPVLRWLDALTHPDPARRPPPPGSRPRACSPPPPAAPRSPSPSRA